MVARHGDDRAIADAAALAKGSPAPGARSSPTRAIAPPVESSKTAAPAGGESAWSARPRCAQADDRRASEPAVPCADTSDLWVSLRESAPAGVKSILRVLTLREQASDALTLEASDPDTLNMARSALPRIREAASSLAGRAIEIRLLTSARVGPGTSPVTGAGSGVGGQSRAQQSGLTVAEREAMEHPLVRTAVDLFGARSVRRGRHAEAARQGTQEDAGV